LTDKFVGDTGRWAHRLLGADFNLPATVIKPPPSSSA
jgi:hypothetical protein